MPLIYELASVEALDFRDRFEQAYGYPAPWEAATAYDAGAMVLKGAGELKLLGGRDSVTRDREAIRGYLAGLSSPERAFHRRHAVASARASGGGDVGSRLR